MANTMRTYVTFLSQNDVSDGRRWQILCRSDEGSVQKARFTARPTKKELRSFKSYAAATNKWYDWWEDI